MGHGIVWLDIALVNHGGVKLPLDDNVSSGKTRLQITAGKPHLAGDVGLLITLFRRPARAQIRQQDWRIVLHGLADIEYRREEFVLDLDERQRLLGDVRAGGGHGRYSMPVVEDLVPSHNVHGQVPRVNGDLAHLVDAGGKLWQVLSGDDHFHSRQGARRRGVD